MDSIVCGTEQRSEVPNYLNNPGISNLASSVDPRLPLDISSAETSLVHVYYSVVGHIIHGVQLAWETEI